MDLALDRVLLPNLNPLKMILLVKEKARCLRNPQLVKLQARQQELSQRKKGITLQEPSHPPKKEHRYYTGACKAPVLVHSEYSDTDEEDLSWFYTESQKWVSHGYG